MTITREQLDRILTLEAGSEADAAFAEIVMGWEPGYDYRDEAIWIDPADGLVVESVEFYTPTQNEPEQWWAGVEKLREWFFISASTNDDTCSVLMQLKKSNGSPRVTWSSDHANPAIALLRAAAQALSWTQQKTQEK